jgi:Ca-activated chloride channel homolog
MIGGAEPSKTAVVAKGMQWAPCKTFLLEVRRLKMKSNFSLGLATLPCAVALLSVIGTPAIAKQIKLDVALAKPTIAVGDGGKSENHMRISLTGFALNKERERMPANVTIVIDKSGSMQGDKIEQARKAAVEAVDRLRDSDIISIVTYDSSVNVIVPATKASDRQAIKAKIREIKPGGNTALFAGVSKGAAEVRKFKDDNRVNRVILLSDGLANVGPSSPGDLEELGASLVKEGISVSTLGLGLGYNEDLMTRLAIASSGNHVFIEDAENLAQVFQNEFDDVLSVVAQKIRIKATMAEGVRPVKVLNYPADITGQQVTIELGQLYASQERYFVLEVEIPHGKVGTRTEVAEVSVEYMNMVTEEKDKLKSTVKVKFTESSEEAEKDVNKEVLAACVIQIANERNRRATELRDAGEVSEAKKLLLENADYLGRNYEALGVPELSTRSTLNGLQAEKLESKDWAGNRKMMREQQTLDATQQSYRGSGAKSDFSKEGGTSPRK